MRTIVYVDGFNLYYGALRGTPYRWLDLALLCSRLLGQHDVRRINYYTARVGARSGDEGAPARQDTYLRALGTSSTVRIHFGHYLSHAVWMPLAVPRASSPRFVRVLRTAEKGSDVNLATHLVSDAYEGVFEAAVLITNDSDLKEPVRLVRDRLRKRVGILNPHEHTAAQLGRVASFVKKIRRGVLEASQFPAILRDAKGLITKPVGW